MQSVARDITHGVPFSDALARHPSCFGPLYCQLVAVGELAGALPTVLARLADDRERAASQRAKLKGALTYPVMVLLLSLLITAGLLVGVVPTFKTIFDGFGAALPAPTRFVLALSDGVARWSVPFAIACAVASIASARLLKRSPAARNAADRATLKLPLVGALLRSLAVARWSRALGTLLSAGTPLSDAFDSLDERHRQPDLRSCDRRNRRHAFATANGSPPRCARSAAFRPKSCNRSRSPRNPARSTPC